MSGSVAIGQGSVFRDISTSVEQPRLVISCVMDIAIKTGRVTSKSTREGVAGRTSNVQRPTSNFEVGSSKLEVGSSKSLPQSTPPDGIFRSSSAFLLLPTPVERPTSNVQRRTSKLEVRSWKLEVLQFGPYLAFLLLLTPISTCGERLHISVSDLEL